VATVVALLLACGHPAYAWIEMDVAAERGGPAGAMAEWARLLDDVGVNLVQIRGVQPADQPHLEARGEGAQQRFKLVGILTRGNRLVLPSGSYAPGDRQKLKAYLDSLPLVTQPGGNQRGRFGLTQRQFEGLFAELAKGGPRDTRDQLPGEFLTRCQEHMTTPLEIDPQWQSALARQPKLQVDLQSLSLGTSLAWVLRSRGLGIQIATARNPSTAPEPERVELRVVPRTDEQELWPVGWKPAKVSKLIAPQMYRITTIEINGYTLERAMTALQPHLAVPVLWDESTIESLKIEPARVQVKLRRGKTFVKRAVDQILAQARLAGELRVDERGQPFYWITQFGPRSLRALGSE
jgi:hypothetical protein